MGKYKYFMVCTTGRSGSTYLCDLLRNTGVAGMSPDSRRKKVHSQFEKIRVNKQRLQSLDWNEEDLSKVIEKLFRETASKNNVCSFKAMYLNIRWLFRVVEKYDRYSHANPGNAGKYFPGGMKAVFLTRRGKLRQAISNARASAKKSWHLYEDEQKAADTVTDFSCNEIAKILARIKANERLWKKFFRQNGIPYMQVEYEALVEDPEPVIRGIFRFLGIPYPKDHVLESRLVRQSDELTEKLVEEFSSPVRKINVSILVLLNRVMSRVYELSYSLKRKSGTYERLMNGME